MSTRISTGQIYDSGQNAMGLARSRETDTAEKATTLKELNRPSDNPGEWKLAQSMKDGLSVTDTLSKDAQLGNNVLAATDTALSQLQENVQRVQELALSVSGQGPQVSGLRKFVLSEVAQIYDGMVQLANTRFAGRSIFAGLRTQEPAFNGEGKYLGDSEDLKIEISQGLKVPINLTGDKAIMGVGLQEGVNILDTVKRLVVGLGNEDTQAIQGSLGDIGRANSQLSFMRSEVGARMSAIKRAVDIQADNKIQTQDSLSRLQDADAVKVFSDLARDQAVLKSAYSTTHKLLSENPADQLFK